MLACWSMLCYEGGASDLALLQGVLCGENDYQGGEVWARYGRGLYSELGSRIGR